MNSSKLISRKTWQHLFSESHSSLCYSNCRCGCSNCCSTGNIFSLKVHFIQAGLYIQTISMLAACVIDFSLVNSNTVDAIKLLKTPKLVIITFFNPKVFTVFCNYVSFSGETGKRIQFSKILLFSSIFFFTVRSEALSTKHRQACQTHSVQLTNPCWESKSI